MPQPLRAYLEAQADRVEALLQPQGLPAKVVGGTVGPRIVRFFLEAPDAAPPAYRRKPLKISEIRPYADDLAIALHVTAVTVSRDFPPDYEGQADLFLEFENPNPQPINLLDLLPQVVENENREPEPLPLTTPLLGLTDDGLPLLFRLASQEVRHVLIAGQHEAGKSVLMRGIALSLALTHDPDDLKVLMIDMDANGPLCDVAPAPHVVHAPASDVLEAGEVLRSLRSLAKKRQQPDPRVVMLIDHTDTAVADLREDVLWLLKHSFEKGIHLVLATGNPKAWTHDVNWERFFGVRIWGRGWMNLRRRTANLPAGQLLGRGDFYASGAGEARGFRFQAAHVGKWEVEQALRHYRRDPQRYPQSISKAAYEARQKAKEKAAQTAPPPFQPEPLELAGAQQLQR
jgi:S-DNA-T family DNA segregation ATPase FtsK/SpoIIIE